MKRKYNHLTSDTQAVFRVQGQDREIQTLAAGTRVRRVHHACSTPKGEITSFDAQSESGGWYAYYVYGRLEVTAS